MKKYFKVSQPTMEKTFAQNHFIMMDRSRDQSTMEKTFAQGRIMHFQCIFHFGDFINATIRECNFPHVEIRHSSLENESISQRTTCN